MQNGLDQEEKTTTTKTTTHKNKTKTLFHLEHFQMLLYAIQKFTQINYP